MSFEWSFGSLCYALPPRFRVTHNQLMSLQLYLAPAILTLVSVGSLRTILEW